jgi:serine/threonine protein kinase
VKLLHPHLVESGSGSSDGAQRLRREADLLATLAHPHVVRAFEGGVWRGTPYLALEWLPGPTLRRRVREGGPLPPAEAAALFALLADALAAVHARGVIHRDVKGENVLLAAPSAAGPAARPGEPPALAAARARLSYRPVLMDFGLARVDADSSITQLGALLGTLGYLAPEQATGTAPPDARADLFAFGVTVYEALTGRFPFEGATELALLHALFNHTPEPPAVLVPSVSPALSGLVMRLLVRDPAGRPASADEVRDALLGVLAEG